MLLQRQLLFLGSSQANSPVHNTSTTISSDSLAGVTVGGHVLMLERKINLQLE